MIECRPVVEHVPECRRLATTRQRIFRRGASTVEFAIVAPLVLLFIWASIEFSRLAMLRHVTDNASYEAARWAIVPGASEQEARDRALAVLAILGIQNATITISPSPIKEDTSAVTVQVDVPVDDNQWLFQTFSGGLTVSSKTTLLTERAPIVQINGVPVGPPPPPPPAPPSPPPPPAPPSPPPPSPPPPSPPPPPPPPSPPSPPPPGL